VVATLSQGTYAGAAAIELRPGRRFVPCLPALRPSLLTPRLAAAPPPFPLAERDARRYYFARNGVFAAARALGLEGQEVLVPAYHHGVEVEALAAAGAVPVFVRVDRGMRLDLEHLEASIGPRTRAIHVIHYLGFPQPMAEILAVARRRDLRVLEDCALALLSWDGDAPLGALGDVGIFCLYKSLPVPNGGVLVLNRPCEPEGPSHKAPLGSTLSHAAGSLLAHFARRYGPGGEAVREGVRRTGRAVRSATGVRALSTGTQHFDPADAGVGMSGLTELILENLDFDAIVATRRRNWDLLDGWLRDVAPRVSLELSRGVCPLFYPLLCRDKEAVGAGLLARGIETVDFWREGHPACPPQAFPEVEALRRGVLELPLHQDLTPDDMAYVASAVEEVLP
jgi:dTDP-4-amino-4,6-dideoxygalactose transaminase